MAVVVEVVLRGDGFGLLEIFMQRRSFITAGASLGLAGVALAAQSQVAQAAAATSTIFDFGAVGDGVTDDSGAFNRALQYAGAQGQTVLVPGRNYAIAKPIVFSSANNIGQPWGLLSQGATLTSKISNGQDVMSLTSNHIVRYFRLTGGLKIQGTGSDGNGLHISALSGSNYVGFYNAAIDGLYVEGAGKSGLLFEGGVFETTIMNSFFQDNLLNGATFAHSKGGVCSAISLIGCYLNQNGQYGLCATNFDAQYGGTTDVRVYGGYSRDNKSYGFYYNNGMSGSGIYQVGFENNCRSLSPGDPNGCHVYSPVAAKMRDCSGYNENGGATYLLRGWFMGQTSLDGCQQAAGGAMAATGKTRLVQVSGPSTGNVFMTQCGGGLDVVSGNAAKWQAMGCTGPSPKGALSVTSTVVSA